MTKEVHVTAKNLDRKLAEFGRMNVRDPARDVQARVRQGDGLAQPRFAPQAPRGRYRDSRSAPRRGSATSGYRPPAPCSRASTAGTSMR